jgi:SAM-dependent methyltransferase
VLARGEIILDVGAGDSPYGERFPGVVRLDPDYRREPPSDSHNAISGLCQCLPFKDGVFTTILACFVLQHVDDVRVSVSELLRVCADDGIIAIYPLWRAQRWKNCTGQPSTSYARQRPVNGPFDALIVHRPGDIDTRQLAAVIAESGALVPPPIIEKAAAKAMEILVHARGTTRIPLIRRDRRHG